MALALFGGTRRALRAERDVRAQAGAMTALPPLPVAAATIGIDNVPGLVGGWMSRDTAMLVPAFARGLQFICGIASSLPLREATPNGDPINAQGFTTWPSYEVGVPRITTIAQTVADLVCAGKAYWLITEAQWNGYPARVRRIDPTEVSDGPTAEPSKDDPEREEVFWTIASKRVPSSEVIDFNTGHAGALKHGWFTLNTAINLEAAANRYALSPLPQIALKSVGLDLDDDEITELLDRWETARRTRGTAYLNSVVDTKEFGWSSSELQLTEARQHAATEIARLLNLDPVWVGAQAGGTSITYSNQQDRNQSLLDGTIMPLLRTIEQRLSMLTPDRVFRFDSVAFLRANLTDRVAAYTDYLAAGVLTVEEVRALEPIVPEGGPPA